MYKLLILLVLFSCQGASEKPQELTWEACERCNSLIQEVSSTFDSVSVYGDSVMLYYRGSITDSAHQRYLNKVLLYRKQYGIILDEYHAMRQSGELLPAEHKMIFDSVKSLLDHKLEPKFLKIDSLRLVRENSAGTTNM